MKLKTLALALFVIELIACGSVSEPSVETDSVEVIAAAPVDLPVLIPTSTPDHFVPFKKEGTSLPVLRSVENGRSASPPITLTPPITQPVTYALPINAGQQNIDWFIGSYVDVAREAGAAIDYREGFMTYDGHKGTDFFIRDLAHMAEGVPVLAARAGRVVETHDGELDTGKAGEDYSQSNFIEIMHDDDSTAIYTHLRQGSLLAAVGDWVAAGQQLALVGNSGSSAHPHLHLEVRAANGRIIDIVGEELIDFTAVYPQSPVVFAVGITNGNDPYIFGDLSRYTPSHHSQLSCAERPYIWFKIIGMKQDDVLHTFLVFPDSSIKEIAAYEASQDYRYVYWYAHHTPLPAGFYTISYYFDENVQSAGQMNLWIVCE